MGIKLVLSNMSYRATTWDNERNTYMAVYGSEVPDPDGCKRLVASFANLRSRRGQRRWKKPSIVVKDRRWRCGLRIA